MYCFNLRSTKYDFRFKNICKSSFVNRKYLIGEGTDYPGIFFSLSLHGSPLRFVSYQYENGIPHCASRPSAALRVRVTLFRRYIFITVERQSPVKSDKGFYYSDNVIQDIYCTVKHVKLS